LLLLFLALPFGAAANEIAAGVALGAGVLVGNRKRWPLAGPVALVFVLLAVSAVGRGQAAMVEALGRTWPLALLIAVPLLADADDRRLLAVERAGLGAAALVGVYAVLQLFVSGEMPWVRPQSAFFGHHLTLGYALLPALARALHRGMWAPAIAIGLGIACSGGSGPLLSMFVVDVGLLAGASNALMVGVVVALAAMTAMGMDGELEQRAVLWASGAQLAIDAPLGVGPDGYRAAVAPVQDVLQPGFHFANHAHDSMLQVAARSGLPSWIAWAWLGVALWRRADAAGRTAIAGLIVGSLTQDTFGDLEVIRACSAWALLPIVGSMSGKEPMGGTPVEDGEAKSALLGVEAG